MSMYTTTENVWDHIPIQVNVELKKIHHKFYIQIQCYMQKVHKGCTRYHIYSMFNILHVQ